MRGLLSVIALVVVLSTASRAALAQHPGAEYGIAPTQPAAPVERDWYGWQIALADLSVAALTLVDDRFIYAHMVSGPIVHFAHGETIHGTISVGLRVTAPWLVGQGAGGLAKLECNDDQQSCDNAQSDGAFAGRAACAALVSVAEMVWLSFEYHRREQPPAQLGFYGVTARPIALATSHGGLLGVAGSF